MAREGKSWSGNERNCCFLNTHGERFATISAVSGFDVPDDARAIAVTDWDNDGKPDCWVANRNAPRLRFFHNECETDNHFLALRLRGVTCNRDAIGARVELFLGTDGQTKRIKTLHAGEGFLAQSSKGLVFGLGNETKIHHVIVRWPGGKPEEFTGLDADKHYTLAQDTARAEQWTPPAATVTLTASTLKVPPSTDQARIVSISKPPMTLLNYTGFDGKPATVSTNHRGQVLVNLWASWCGPCVKELGEFAREQRKFRAAGLDIVALSVDGLGGEHATGPTDAKRFLDKQKFPFTAGMATPELLEKLEVIQRGLLDMQKPLPVPNSFLIDRNHQLVAIYKGAVGVEQLMADLRLADLSPADLRNAAVPFPGRWITAPLKPYPQDIALKFLEEGNRDAAIVYLQQSLTAPLARADNTDRADMTFLLGQMLCERNRTAEGQAAYEQAVKLDPGYRKAHINLGDLLLQQQRVDEAATHFETALLLDPGDPEVLIALGATRARQRRFDEAIGYYRAALRLNPANGLAQANLATALHGAGRVPEAVMAYREALRLRRQWPSGANNLAWILATHDDPQIRNAADAIQLAEQACEQTQRKDPRFLSTLAAAYAEAGRFKDAVATAKLALAAADGQSPIVAEIQKHLQLYEAGRTYHQSREAKP